MIRLTALTIFTIASLFGCGAERYSWNERTTVTVQTPDGLVTGTSVIEFRAAWCEGGCGLAGDISFQTDYRGEAVVVEVLPDRYLFVLPRLRMISADRYARELFGEIEDTGDRLQTAHAITEVIDVPQEYYPNMLTFLEVGDPNSLREVDPADIEATFGAGVEILSITLEVTNDPVSDPVVADLFRWTCEPRRRGDGRIVPFRVPNDSPRGWYSFNGFYLGHQIQICS